MSSLISLPQELITQILLYLPPYSLTLCRQANKLLNNTISDSLVLQHKLALHRAYAEDSPLSKEHTANKLKQLRKTEDAWTNVTPDFQKRSKVPIRQSGVYDLSAGIYLLSSADRSSIGLLSLPSKGEDGTEWLIHNVGKIIVDVGLAVYEHDLMAVVTSSVRIAPDGEPNTFDIAIDLLQLSTQTRHPLAQQNPLFVMNSAWERPGVGIEIVGKHLVLVLCFHARGHPNDCVFIFDWQTGVTIANFEARSHTYAGLIFLDEMHFLLPNTRANALDIYRIPDEPTPEILHPVLILALPQLAPGRILAFMTCRAEPNPISESSYPAMRARAHASREDASIDVIPSRSFLLKSQTALCLFELRIHVREYIMMPGGGVQVAAFPFRYSFSFATQRHKLLDLVHAFGGTEGPSRTLSAPSILARFLHPPNETHSTTAPYNAWGPLITAWLGGNENDVSTHWITTSAGRRCVRMDAPSGSSTGERFYVYEFGREANAKGEEENKAPADENDNDNDSGGGGADQKKDKGKGRADDACGDVSGGQDNSVHTTRPPVRTVRPRPRLSHTQWLLQVPGGLPLPVNAVSLEQAATTSTNGVATAPEAGDNISHHQFDDGGEADTDMEEAMGTDEEEDALAQIHAEEGTDMDDDDDSDSEAGWQEVEGGGMLEGNEAGPDDEQDHEGDTDENMPGVTEASFDEDESWTLDPLPGPDEDVIAVRGLRSLDCPEVFTHPVQHGLPYIVRASRERYQWDGVLMDEERVMGVKATESGQVEYIDVLHFG